MSDKSTTKVHSMFEDQPTVGDPLRTFTLPSRYYLDPSVFEHEKQCILYKGWHYVTHVHTLAAVGDYASTIIGDEKVFVIKGKDERIRAFYNVCKHRAHHLVEGCGNKDAIVCPYHAWRYELDGSLHNAPLTDDLPEFDKSKFGLTPVAVDVVAGLVLVNLDPDAGNMDEYAPGLREDLESKVPWLAEAHSVRDCSFGDASMKANWKVVVDNFVECYHCPGAHPAFADMIHMQHYEHDVFENWSRQLGPSTSPDSSAYSFDADTAVPRAMFWYIYPAFTINVTPGYKLANVLTIFPVDVAHTSFAGQAVSAHEGVVPERVYEYLYDELGAEDQALCESVQRGLKSRSYNQGPFAVDAKRSGVSEHALHDFHQRILRALN